MSNSLFSAAISYDEMGTVGGKSPQLIIHNFGMRKHTTDRGDIVFFHHCRPWSITAISLNTKGDIERSRRSIPVACCTMKLRELFCFVLFCFVLFCFVLFCFVLFCFVLFCFVLFCFVLFLNYVSWSPSCTGAKTHVLYVPLSLVQGQRGFCRSSLFKNSLLFSYLSALQQIGIF